MINSASISQYVINKPGRTDIKKTKSTQYKSYKRLYAFIYPLLNNISHIYIIFSYFLYIMIFVVIVIARKPNNLLIVGIIY